MKNESNIKFDKILSSLRKNKGWTMEELGEKMNKTKSAISRWESGDNSPKVEDIEKLSELFDINIQSLIFGVSEQEESILPIYNQLNKPNQSKVINFSKELLEKQNSKIIDSRKFRDVRVISKAAAGKTGFGIVDLDPEYTEIVSYDGYIPDKYDMAFEVSGDSMEPLFRNGELIFLKKDSEVRNGQLGVVLINEEAFIKKMYVEEDKLRLVSLNKKYDDIIANGTDDIKVVGRVII